MKNRKDAEKRAKQIDKRLAKVYPHAETALDYKTPLQLLIATILAAQCTDKRVNELTPGLFKKYKSAKDFANADREDLEEDIRPTGFFRQKAKSIMNCCKKIVEEHDGNVPRTREEMVKLPGVGRKTANVVLGDCFDVPGIIVDTHMKRVSQRLGLTKNSDPTKIEFDLMDILPEDRWTPFSHEITLHGRNTCVARKPRCPDCEVENLCPYENKTK